MAITGIVSVVGSGERERETKMTSKESRIAAVLTVKKVAFTYAPGRFNLLDGTFGVVFVSDEGIATFSRTVKVALSKHIFAA